MTDRRLDRDAPDRLATDGGAASAAGDAVERVLVPLPILEGTGVSDGIAAFLSTTDVVLLGYHEVPEQTPPDMMRQQYEAQAQNALSDLAEAFRAAGGAVDTRLVFTHDREQTVDRVAAEVESTAILLPNAVATVESILVPLHGDVDAARIVDFVARVRGGRDIDVTLFAATREDERERAAAADVLATAVAALEAAGVPDDAVSTETRTSPRPIDAIIDAAIDRDAVVMGERAPDWRSLLFGELHDRVAAESLGPVLVVRRRGE